MSCKIFEVLTPNTYNMNKSLKCSFLFACMATLGYGQQLAQNHSFSSFQEIKAEEISKRAENFNKLKALGYSDQEVFEDLGNANFLAKKYENALYWYGRLMEISEDGTLKKSYQKRFDHAVAKLGKQVQNEVADENWTELIKEDYKMTNNTVPTRITSSHRSNFLPLQFEASNDELASNLQGLPISDETYAPPVALTNGGNTAYFTKTTYRKPVTGIFSKKKEVHKIYKADKIAGEWKHISEVPLCPSDFSATHPAVSPDGSRLFFASNMPGSYGEYDIYVASIQRNGAVGIAKNLGNKVNTSKDDMHPNPVGDGTLLFASNGREGYGGLDVFMVEVGKKSVGLAVNMGSNVNSRFDEYSIRRFQPDGSGFVVSNRNNSEGKAQHIAFNLNDKSPSDIDRDYHFLEAFNTQKQTQYSSSVFEDE